MISANSCGLIERCHGEGQVFHRSNNSSGKIYALTEGPYLLCSRPVKGSRANVTSVCSLWIAPVNAISSRAVCVY
jgi:hypothetical protein